MVDTAAQTKWTFQIEESNFPWIKDYLNSTFVEKMSCLSSAEMVALWIIFSIQIPVVCLSIFGLCCLFRSNQSVNVFVINLFITDIIQICLKPILHYCALNIVILSAFYIYSISLTANIGFMVCISLEKYIMIKYPVWYRFHRRFKHSLSICLLVWAIACAEIGVDWIFAFQGCLEYAFLVYVFVLLMPYPLVVFSLVGSWRALSNSVSITPDEQRKILTIQALVLFNYTLLFLPSIVQNIIFSISFEHGQKSYFDYLHAVSGFLLYLNPLADSLLYVFIRKDANYMLRCLCCKNLVSNQEQPVESFSSLSRRGEAEISVQVDRRTAELDYQ